MDRANGLGLADALKKGATVLLPTNSNNDPAGSRDVTIL